MLEPLRDKVVKELTRHCGDGRLTLDELESRIEEAYAAGTEQELRDLVADLPPSNLPEVADPTPKAMTPPLPPLPKVPAPRPPKVPDQRLGFDGVKAVSTLCGIGGLVLLLNGMFWLAIIVWFVVPGLLIHDRRND